LELIADILLVAGALGAGLYCFVLSRRLKRFTDLEKGVGGAVAVLSSQADELKKSLDAARDSSEQSGAVLKEQTQRAEAVAQRLELMMASMHDVVPAEEKPAKPVEPEPVETVEESPAKPEEPGEASAAEPEDMAETTDTSVEPEESVEAPEGPAEPEPETPAKPATKRPDGLMFFRHGRSQGEAAT